MKYKMDVFDVLEKVSNMYRFAWLFRAVELKEKPILI